MPAPVDHAYIRVLMSLYPERPMPPDGGLSRMHLTGINALSDDDLIFLLKLAQYYRALVRDDLDIPLRLKGRTQVNLFFENSTRTNCSFELAGKKLGADVIVVPVAASSVHKGEELQDTTQTLAAMGADAMVVRNKEHDTAEFVSSALGKAGIPCAVINAGEGTRSHPTQALLDAATMLESLGRTPEEGLKGITVAICGDVRHSRVAGSNAELLPRLGAEVRFVGPEQLHPAANQYSHVERYTTLKQGLAGCDFVMALRMQMERMESGYGMTNEEYHATFGLTHDTLPLASPNAKVMHPGPMNRGIEISGTLADDRSRSLILDQVSHGVTTRMAVLDALLTEQE